jgi:hypothetical protein
MKARTFPFCRQFGFTAQQTAPIFSGQALLEGTFEGKSRTVQVVGDRLAALWQGSAMSKATFAAAVGMKQSNIFRLTRPGVHRMFTDNFRKMAEVLKLAPTELQRLVGPPSEEHASVSGVCGTVRHIKSVPGYQSISAGIRSERVAVEVGHVKIPVGAGDFAVQIDGESMRPTYPHGATALFETVEGQVFVFGKDYLLWFTNGECYFSRVLESEEDRDVLVLRKINPDRTRFADRLIHRREIAHVARCVGVVICTR